MLTSVTVVITTKNRPAYAAEAITSVIDQTEPAINIVVVDDGSELPIEQQLEMRLAEKCTFIRNESSFGVSAARNIGAKAASGDWVLFLDDDDWFSIDYIKELSKALKTVNNNTVHFCWPSRTLVDASSGSRTEKNAPKPLTATEHPNLESLKSLMDTGCSGTAFKVSTLTAVGGFDESLTMSEDRDLSFRLLASGYSGHPVAGARIFVRIHDSERLSTNTKDNSQAESDMRVIAKNIELLRQYPLLAEKYIGRVAKRLWERGFKKEAIQSINLLCSIHPLSIRARKRQIVWTLKQKFSRDNSSNKGKS